jgi:flagellar hook-basal body complex protein FliE
MKIDAMQAHLRSLERLAAAAGNRPHAAAGGGDNFGDHLAAALRQVNELQGEADRLVQEVQTGRSSDVIKAVVALEKADMSLQLLLQVRNKALSAYEEIMRMQM